MLCILNGNEENGESDSTTQHVKTKALTNGNDRILESLHDSGFHTQILTSTKLTYKIEWNK